MQVILLLSAMSLAADPLVATGPIPEAVRQAVTGSGRPESSFLPVPWADLVSRPPGLVGEGTWTPCAGPRATSPQLALAVDGAESALGYGNLEKANGEIVEADRLAACLGEDPPTALLARWHRARGAFGDATSLSLARTLDPALTWPPSWPSEGAAAFEAARPSDPVAVAVRAWGADVHIDGAKPKGILGDGLHVLRAGPVTGLLGVAGEPLELVLTPTFPTVGPTRLADPAIREDTAALLQVHYGAGTRVFIADADEAWATSAGRTDWTALRTVRRSPLIPVGAAIAAPAALTGVVALGLARAAHGDVTTAASDMGLATTTADFSCADERYQDGARRFRTLNGVAIGAGAVAAVGAALLSVGVARGEIEVRATVTSGGGLLGVGVRR